MDLIKSTRMVTGSQIEWTGAESPAHTVNDALTNNRRFGCKLRSGITGHRGRFGAAHLPIVAT